MKRRSMSAAAAFLSTLLIGAACEPPTGPDRVEASPGSEAPTRSDAAAPGPDQARDFHLFRQNFNSTTEGWVDAGTPGPAGWCGEIQQRERDPAADLQPSEGRGYATVRQGSCNAFHQGRGFLASAPAGGAIPLNHFFPTGGYSHSLDVYLDPDWPEGTAFVYGISFQDLDHPVPLSFRYVSLPVSVADEAVQVGPHAVTEAGWYTIRHRFHEEEGQLALEAGLASGGRTLATWSMSDATTLFSGETVSDFPAENTGSGYLWFVEIREGLELPIDTHRLDRVR